MLDIDAIKPFRHHPFHLYEEERLNDMVESIKEHGVLNPVIMRKMHYRYEMLSDHNHQNAAKLVKQEEKPEPIKLSAGFREKYFNDTDSKEIEGIIKKALIAWFKKRR